MPRIDGPNIYLRPMQLEDAQLVVAWRTEPATRALFLRPQPSLADHLTWFSSERLGRVDYVAVLRSEDRPVGTVNYSNIDEVDRTATTGTLIGDTRDRGRGLGREVKALWMLFGFAELSLASVDVVIRADNVAMINLDTSLGYRKVGEESIARAEGGETVDFIRMRLTRASLLAEPVYASYDSHGFLDVIESKEEWGGT